MEKTYRVLIGRRFGHAEGETFRADLPPEQEQRHLACGGIEIVRDPSPVPERLEGDADGDDNDNINLTKRGLFKSSPNK